MKLERKALLLLPLAAAVSAAWADDGYTTLDTSVISAAGYAQDTREAPASVSVITAEELATKPIIDIGTAVGDVPGVDISQNKWARPKSPSAGSNRATRRFSSTAAG